MNEGTVGERVTGCVLAMPEVASWSMLRDYVAARPGAAGHTIWSYPLHAGEAFGQDQSATLPAAAAIYAGMLAIHLVDDLLDEDERGFHHRVGVGGAANLASSLQGVSHALLAGLPLSTEASHDVQRRLGLMFLQTARGQSLELRAIQTEPDYWAAARAKTPPLLAAALAIGSRLAGADAQVADGMTPLADHLGCLIQVGDDVSDATAVPAKADWRPGSCNLPILFAHTADHPARDAFVALAAKASTDAEALRRAQNVLLRCGAISYCVHVMFDQAALCRQAIERLAVPDPAPLHALVDSLIEPAERLLATGDSPSAQSTAD